MRSTPFVIVLALFAVITLLTLTPNPVRCQERVLMTEELARRADVIVVAKVTMLKSEWTSDKSRIYTNVTLSIDQQLKGDGNETSMTISTLGGEVGGVGEVYSHLPRFKLNEQVVVFAEKDRNGQLQVLGGNEGKLVVMNEESTGRQLVANSESLEIFTSRVRSIVQAQRQK